MGRPIFAFNPKSPSPDWSTSMKVMATTRTRCLYIRVQSMEYIRMERNIYEPTAGHIDGQPVWKYFTPRDVIYNFITESIYRCSIEGVVDRSIWTVECRLFRIELFLEKRPPIGQRKRLVWKWRIEWSDIAIETEISKIWRYELKGCARYLNGFELNGNNWIANSEGNYNARIIRIGDTSNISEIL